MSNKEKKHKLQEELNETQNKYLRLLAELENTRKRMQKEKSEALVFAIENTIAEFLPIIDNFENALNFANESSAEVKNWAIGFQMILSQLKDILHNHGIVAFHSVGNIFDPYYHEAMEIVETNDHPDGSIIEEFAKGYKSINRIIRPAKVKVVKKITEKSFEEEKTDEKLINTQTENDKTTKETAEDEKQELTNKNMR
jgi:molecular chaperone GrpE